MQTLGEKLKSSINAAAQAKAQALAAEQAKADRKSEKMREAVQSFFTNAKNHITVEINAGRFGDAVMVEIGRKPSVSCFPAAAEVLRHAGIGYPQSDKVKPECAEMVEPVWSKFQAWADSQGLCVTWEYLHDGYGRHSWAGLKVVPAE